MKLLVVDDSSTMRRIIKNTLQRLGFNDVLEAEHGVEAWQIMERTPDINVLITDWNMPEMNGLDLVRKVRAEKKYENRPIIVTGKQIGRAHV